MTKSQNTKNEQQKDLCITNEQLTEQWKKGELPAGRYWVKYRSGRIDDLDLLGGKTIETKPEIVEVLAEVPDYVEWRNIINCACEEHEANKRFIEENAQLKEQINKYYLDAINRGTANAVKAVKEFGMPERIKELVKQNAKLRELLKECFIAINQGSFWDECEVLHKIEQALG